VVGAHAVLKLARQKPEKQLLARRPFKVVAQKFGSTCPSRMAACSRKSFKLSLGGGDPKGTCRSARCRYWHVWTFKVVQRKFFNGFKASHRS
jgi:hypothetical protein